MKLTGDTSRQRECALEIVAWLHAAWEMMEKGTVIQPNPFYARDSLLTPEVIDNVLASLEGIFINEFKKYPGYHNQAQGIVAGEKLVPPGFDKLPLTQKRAIVQGIDRICFKFAATD